VFGSFHSGVGGCNVSPFMDTSGNYIAPSASSFRLIFNTQYGVSETAYLFIVVFR